MSVGGLQSVAMRIAAIQQQVASVRGFGETFAQVRDSGAGAGRAGAVPDSLRESLASAPSAVPAPVAPPPPPGLVAALSAPPTAEPAAVAGLYASAPTALGSLATTGAAAGEWAQRLPAAGQPWAAAVTEAAERAGVDPPLLAALVWAESGFRAEARSHAGAIGLAQLMPGTARGLGVDPHDPAQNLAGAARYLREQLDRFGTVELALAAYNAGPGRVAQAGGIPAIAETRAYVPRVMDYYARLGGRPADAGRVGRLT